MAVGVTGFDGRPGRVLGVSAPSADGASNAAVMAPLAFRNSRRPWMLTAGDLLIGSSSLDWDYEFHHSPQWKREKTEEARKLARSLLCTGLRSRSRNPGAKKAVQG